MDSTTAEPAVVLGFRASRRIPELGLAAGQDYTFTLNADRFGTDEVRLVHRLMGEGALCFVASPSTFGDMAAVTLAVIDRSTARARTLPEPEVGAEMDRISDMAEQCVELFRRSAGAAQ